MAKVFGANLALIDKLGDDLDFYYWKGVLCCRMMPKKIFQPGTPAQKDTWKALQYANDEYNRLGQQERDAFKDLAEPSQMSGRDLFIKMILSNYKEFGENHARFTAQFMPQPGGWRSVRFYREVPCRFMLMAMTTAQVWRACEWREITPILRGKRLLRRWDLRNDADNAAYAVEFPSSFPYGEVVYHRTWGWRYFTAYRVDGEGAGFGRSGLYRW